MVLLVFEKMIKSQLARKIDSRVLLAMVAKAEKMGEKLMEGQRYGDKIIQSSEEIERQIHKYKLRV